MRLGVHDGVFFGSLDAQWCPERAEVVVATRAEDAFFAALGAIRAVGEGYQHG
jgi:hypothetical protein